MGADVIEIVGFRLRPVVVEAVAILLSDLAVAQPLRSFRHRPQRALAQERNGVI